MDTWSRPFFSYPSSSVNSQLCRPIVVVCSCDAKQPDCPVQFMAQLCAVPCTSLSSLWLGGGGLKRWRRIENSVPSWLLGVNSKSRSGAGVELQCSHGAKGATVIYRGWEVPLLWSQELSLSKSWRKLTPAPFETHSGLLKRGHDFPWMSECLNQCGFQVLNNGISSRFSTWSHQMVRMGQV